METSAIRLEERNDGLIEIFVDDVSRGRFAGAKQLAMHLGLCIVRIDDLDRAVEASRRYFEHCERVSLSARGAVCDSGEMYPVFDRLDSLLSDGYTIAKRDTGWCLYGPQNVLACHGLSFRGLCANIVLAGL